MVGQTIKAGENLWDQQQGPEFKDSHYSLSHKGLDGVRFYRGALGDNKALAQDYGNAGNAAMTQAMDMYGQQAMGLGPSLSQATMQQGLEANNRAAMGLMGQARGGNVAGAYQQALGAQNGANLMTAQQGAINAMAEQQQGLAGYAGLAGQSAQLGQNYAQLTSQHQLQSDQNDLGWYAAKRGMDLQKQQGQRDFNMGLVNAGVNTLGSVLSAVGGVAGSDPRMKTGLQPTSVADAAAEVGGAQYQYKPGMGPAGEQFGVDAAQLAQTSLGPTLVRQGPDGMLGVDGTRAGIAGLAASGENTRRLQAIEQRLGMATSDPFQGDRGYQGGGFEDRLHPHTIDPFDDEPPQRMPDQHGGEVAVLPRRRQAPQVQSGLGMRGQNVGDIHDEQGNPIDYRADIVPYEAGSATPFRADLRRAESTGPITPEWQAAIDAMNDYNDRWLTTDESGGRHYAGQEMDMGVMPRGLQREVDALDAADRDAAIRAQDLRDTARPRPPMSQRMRML